MSSGEPTEADTLVGVQLGVALAVVLAGLLGTRVLLEGGHVAGAQDVVFSEDGRTHQNDLRAEKQCVEAKPELELFDRVTISTCAWLFNPWMHTWGQLGLIDPTCATKFSEKCFF